MNRSNVNFSILIMLLCSSCSLNKVLTEVNYPKISGISHTQFQKLLKPKLKWLKKNDSSLENSERIEWKNAYVEIKMDTSNSLIKLKEELGYYEYEVNVYSKNDKLLDGFFGAFIYCDNKIYTKELGYEEGLQAKNDKRVKVFLECAASYLTEEEIAYIHEKFIIKPFPIRYF